MSLLVTGSIGIDTVTTPFGVSENCIGGSAVYFCMSASYFTHVRFVGAVGADCPFDLREVFSGRDVDLKGLEVRNASKTFRWKGSYHNTMSEVITDMVELNVLAEAPPKLPREFRDSKFVFLANTMPSLQMQLLGQIEKPVFVVADTMNFYIDGYLDDLKRLLQKINCLVVNETEARALAKEANLIKAAAKILELGPEFVVVKKGESGSLLKNRSGEMFVLPAYPAEVVKDPTGAGDSFAGGFMGYIAQQGKTDFATLKKAIAYGTVVASFTISQFSINGLASINKNDIEKRLEILRKATLF